MLLRLPLIIMSLYCASALIVLLVRAHGGNSGRSAAWLLLGVMIWHAGIRLPLTLTLDMVLPAWMSVLILGGAGGLGIGCVLFALSYPYRRLWLTITACAIALIGSTWILYILSLPTMIKRGQLLGILLRPQGALPPLELWLLLCLALPIIRLSYHAIHARGYQRLQIRYICCGLLILISGLLMNLFLLIGHTLIPVVLIPLLVQGLGIGILAYAFTRLPLVDGKVALRMIITIAVSLGILYLVCARLYIKLALFLISTLHQSLITSTVVSSVVLSLLFLLLIYVIGRVVDRYLLRSPYDERKVATQISEALLLAVDVETVVTRLTSIVNRTIKPATVGCYLPDEDGALVRLQPPAEADDLPAQLDAAGSLLDAIRRFRTVQQAELLLQHRSDDAASGHLLMAQGIRIVVPLWREHLWYGCLLLGEKASGDAYTAADTFLLQTISAQTSLALENVRSHEDLRQLNAELEHRIAQRTQELADANAQLRLADQSKDRFLAIVSHELVNPLTSIIGWASVGLRSDDVSLMKRSLQMVTRSGEQQNRLICDLLDTSRLIHGKLTVQCRPANLWTCFEETLETFVLRAQEKHVALMVQPPTDPLPASIDPARIQQVIANLLSNAIKFTPAGGTITVSGWHDATHNIITIQDTGKGIPAEQLASIFVLFHQGTSDDIKQGLGLGLALVDGILRLHGGTVTAESPGVDQGSTFTIAVPMALPRDEYDLPELAADGSTSLLMTATTR